MPGYSGTPLARKLGIRAGSEVVVVGAPPGYDQLLEPLPAGARLTNELSPSTHLVHFFTRDRAELDSKLHGYRRVLGADVVLWVSWPKKASRVPTNVSEDVIRELALPLGFVDVKVCAVDDVWSALKLVVRKELR